MKIANYYMYKDYVDGTLKISLAILPGFFDTEMKTVAFVFGPK